MASVPLPNLIIGGAQRSGTTTLHALLGGHPSVFAPRRHQEIHYFDLDRNFERGLGWLGGFYRHAGTQPVRLQTSPLYLYDERCAGRIAAAIPSCRLLFVLRDPVARAYSHYWHEVRLGWERLSFPEALAREEERIGRSYEARRHFSYLDRGRYALQLGRYRERFAASQVRVVTTDRLATDQTALRNELADWLGIDVGAWTTTAPVRRNGTLQPRWPWVQRATYRWRDRWPRVIGWLEVLNLRSTTVPPLAATIADELRSRVADDIRATAELTGLDLTAWLPC